MIDRCGRSSCRHSMNFPKVKTLAKALTIAYAALALSACSTMKKSVYKLAGRLHIIEYTEEAVPSAVNANEMPKELFAGLAALNKNDFQGAYEVLRDFLSREPATPWTLSAKLNYGRALQGLDRWSEAAELFRDVATASGEAPRLQAMALYHQAFCKEALGDDPGAVAVLHDLSARLEFLPDEIRYAELPARLAGAYARVGNFNRAIELYQESEGGIGRMVQLSNREGTGEIPKWLGKTLYYMGHTEIAQISWDNFETSLRPLARSQVYLLQAAELDQEPWASRAYDDVVKTYGHLWRLIENLPPTGEVVDAIVVRREQQKTQTQHATILLEAIAALKTHSLPGIKLGKKAEEILTYADQMQAKIEALLIQRPAGEAATRELYSGEPVRGEIIDPDSSLEKKFLRSSSGTPHFAPQSSEKSEK